jgi:hypothetical protein
MTATPERKPHYRRPPTWGIHDASGVRYPGGDGATWWDDARPADPEPAGARPEPAAIYGADCTT